MTGAAARVAVIIPAYNGAELLGQALKSVLAQTYADWEEVVVDDASSDQTHAVATAFADRDPGRLTVIRLEDNVGVGGARTAGIARSAAASLCACWIRTTCGNHATWRARWPPTTTRRLPGGALGSSLRTPSC